MNKRKNVNTIICLLLVLIFAFTGCKNQKNIENTEKNKNFNFEDINISDVVEPNLVKFHDDSIYVQGVDKNSVNNFFNLGCRYSLIKCLVSSGNSSVCC